MKVYITNHPEGIDQEDVIDAYKGAKHDFELFKDQISLQLDNEETNKKIVFPKPPSGQKGLDESLINLWKKTKVPTDRKTLEHKLMSKGLLENRKGKKRFAGDLMSTRKPRKKRRRINRFTRLTNTHLR